MDDAVKLKRLQEAAQPAKTTKSDAVAMAIKGACGAFPIIGPMAAEVVGALIPNQRIDRISDMLRMLDERVQDIESDRLNARFQEEPFIDLFEDGLLGASRALSDERKQYIAAILESGIRAEVFEATPHKMLMDLLTKLTDVEVILLHEMFVGRKGIPASHEFKKKHENVFKEPPRHEDIAANKEWKVIRKHQMSRLEEFGLIGFTYDVKPVGNRPIQFDEETGKIKRWHQPTVTSLGQMLIDCIGVGADVEKSD